MATGGAARPTPDLTFEVPSGLRVTVSQGDIFGTSAEAFATGEDIGLSGAGLVSRRLHTFCPPQYQASRKALKHKTSKVEVGGVYPVRFPNSNTTPGVGKGLNFSVVFLTVVPQSGAVKLFKDWIGFMRKTYFKLFSAVDTEGLRDLALPLLGSGGAGGSMDDCMEALTSALTLFKFRHANGQATHLREVIIYAHKPDVYHKMVSRLSANKLAKKDPRGASARTPRNKQPSSAAANQTHRGVTSSSSSSSAVSQTQRVVAPSSSSSSAVSQTQRVVAPSSSSAAAASQSRRVTKNAKGQYPEDCSNLAVILGELSMEENMEVDDDDGEQQGVNWLRSSSEEDEETEEAAGEGEEEDGGLKAKPSGKNDKKQEADEEDEKCPICLDLMVQPKKLDKCGHVFCRECIEDAFRQHKPACPTCNTLYAVVTGNQPPGTMSVRTDSRDLPGHSGCGAIIIDYVIHSGIQGPEHPNQGQQFHGTRRQAYLPNNEDGRTVCRLLRVAFDNRLVFTVGTSRTSGRDNVVTWNDIHHKTSYHGGPTEFGYPDPHYLSRVQEELAVKGVTKDSLQGRNFDL